MFFPQLEIIRGKSSMAICYFLVGFSATLPLEKNLIQIDRVYCQTVSIFISNFKNPNLINCKSSNLPQIVDNYLGYYQASLKP